MKLKGVNVFEANADKIVLGVTGLTFLGVLAMQFLGGSYIKVGSNDKLTPGSAFVPVEEEAKKLMAKLDSKGPKTPEPPQFTLTSKLEDLAGKPLGAADGGTTLALGPAPVIQMASIESVAAAAAFALPKLPLPAPAVAAPYSATVSPVEVVLHPELASLLPKEQPFDKMIVSIESSFDGAALRDALLADPDGTGPLEPLPLAWWRDPQEQGDDLVSIVGIEAERELIRNPDGTSPEKPEVVMVQAAPARVDGLAMWKQNVHSLGDVPPTILTLRSEIDQVLRPTFYQTIAGPAWVSPVEYVAQGDVNQKSKQVKLKKQSLATLDKRIATVQDLISKAPDPGVKRPDAPREGGGGGGGGRGRPGGGGGGPSGPAPKAEAPKGDKRVLEAQMRNLEAQRQRLVDDLTKLGERVDGVNPNAPSTQPLGPPPGLLEGGEQKIWVHDVNAVPGAVYRYHLRVVVNNPVYGRNLQDTQKSMADDSLIRSEWSEWSAPVQVDHERVMFVSSAVDAGGFVPRPHASVDLYQCYYRQAGVGLDPGEPAEGTAKLPELKMAAMTTLKTMVEKGDPALGVQPDAPPPPQDGGRRNGPGGRGRPGEFQPGRGGGSGPAGGQPGPAEPTTPESKFPAWMSIDGPKSLPLGGDMVFLDASVVPLSAGTGIGTSQAIAALFRDPHGLIVVRRPDQERQDPYFARVSASAKAGQTQGVEIKPIEPVKPFVPPGRDRPAPPRTGGGGGGGGG
ncbi:MAG: hypothetical protein WC718_08120 [Phycisphaerales bacterium]|jgi:hypothetical protein